MTGALLLDNTYSPLAVVSSERAVTMVVTDLVDVLETRSGSWHSEKLIVPDPSVIRLRRGVPHKAKRRHRPPRPTNREILTRDAHRCGYCGRKATTVDHIVPRSRGGADTWENLVAACMMCNQTKADRFLADLGWQLKVTPHQPSGTHWMLVGVRNPDPNWAEWLS